MVIRDLRALNISSNNTNNDLQHHLKQICERNEIVIRPADKGGGVVILDKSKYLEEMHRLLSDRTTYSPLACNPTTKFKRELQNLINRGYQQGILNKKEKAYLVPSAPRVPVMYYLPKIHKNLTHPPGRPIISGIESVTARIGKYVDNFLQPLVGLTPSYLKDTTQVINLLEGLEWRDGYILATADVASLYTIISHQQGFEAVNYYLDLDPTLPELQKQFIMALLNFATSHNYFWFGGDFFLQICGVAMGAKFAPSLANLFMARWEKEVIDTNPPKELRLWRRYIDDVLLVWDGDMPSLENFFSQLNSNNRGISLQFEASQSRIHFLDLNIMVANGSLFTSTHFKETDRNAYIPLSSCHHPSWLNSVPLSQFQRIRRNCTNTSDYHSQALVLKQRFLDKGYLENDIDITINKVATMDRSQMLNQDRERNPGPTNKFEWSMITGFSNQHYSIKKNFRKHWGILQNDPVLRTVIPDKPVLIYRGAPSLRHSVASNVVDPPRTVSFFQNMKGFFPCRRCKICQINSFRGRKCETFSSTVTNKVYNIESFITCSTQYVVYLIQCPCSKQYIGRTKRELHVRLSEHVANIKRGFTKHNLSRHYAKYHNKKLQGTLFLAIDRVRPHWRGTNMVRSISRLETRWIFNMLSSRPQGLNVEWDINCFINNA